MAAMAAQSELVHELKKTPSVPVVQEKKSVEKKNPPARPLGMIIKVKSPAKKAKIDHRTVEEPQKTGATIDDNTEK
ncbi:hypothetical protein O6P43_010927 [Quillaja saponaria]|uniref:Uncharacterized protein n=1 Tax=Quillaja saponaria TaxID=32244 RepID=A0AAD7VER5_QUISA|nr:hypothetical protein O6P43_010927 [Quillaja saponaria]